MQNNVLWNWFNLLGIYFFRFHISAESWIPILVKMYACQYNLETHETKYKWKYTSEHQDIFKVNSKEMLLFLQLRMRVYDDVYPDNYDEDVLAITVTRNLNAPVILNLANLQVTVWDTHPIGDLIVDVNATDADNVSHPNTCTDFKKRLG